MKHRYMCIYIHSMYPKLMTLVLGDGVIMTDE